MSTALSTAKLHFNKREVTLLVPLYITALAAIISVLIALIIWRAGGEPGSADWIEGSRYNPGMAYALAGFLAYLGVQAVATTFPFGLTLGATRRAFTVGTVLWAATIAAYMAGVFALMLIIETLTGHWFFGFYIFDVVILGAGDIGRLLAIVFLSVLALLTLGGTFGASWVRVGARGPVMLGFAIGVVSVVIMIIGVPFAADLFAAFELWWLAIAAGVVVAASSVGTWLLLRNAAVR